MSIASIPWVAIRPAGSFPLPVWVEAETAAVCAMPIFTPIASRAAKFWPVVFVDVVGTALLGKSPCPGGEGWVIAPSYMAVAMSALDENWSSDPAKTDMPSMFLLPITSSLF